MYFEVDIFHVSWHRDCRQLSRTFNNFNRIPKGPYDLTETATRIESGHELTYCEK